MMKIQYVQGKPFFTYINKNKKQYPYGVDIVFLHKQEHFFAKKHKKVW